MPRFDGTGPLGRGPGTGRGRGMCAGVSTLCDPRRPPGKIILSFAAAVAGVVIKDAMNPGGITRKLFRTLGNCITGRLRKPETDSIRTLRSVDAEVLPNPRKLK